MNCLKSTSLKTFVKLALLLIVAPLALGSSFSIEDYRPIYFSDLQWILNGTIGADGANNQSDKNTRYTDHWLSDYISNSSETSSSNQTISLDNWINYERVRPNSEFDLAIRLGLGGHRTGFDQNKISFDSLLNNVANQYERDNNSYNVDFSLNNSTTFYSSGNLFLRPHFKGNWRQSEVIGSDWDSERTTVYRHGEYYQISNSRTEGSKPTLSRSRAGELGISVGLGRIYRGYYGATALYMVEELDSKGLLNKNPSRSQLKELSALIHKYKEQHTVDKRIHKIKSLKALIGYLENEEIIDDYGADSYLHILDVWDYFPHNGRSFGYEVSGGLSVQYSDRTSDQTDEYDSRYYLIEYHQDSLFAQDTTIQTSMRHRYTGQLYGSRNLSAHATIEYHKPINMLWQFDCSLSGEVVLDGYQSQQRTYIYYDTLRFGRDWYQDSRSDIDESYGLYISTDLTYIMDSRTSIKSSIDASRSLGSIDFYSYQDNDGVRVGDRKDSTSNISTYFSGQISINYRIAIPTTFTCSVRYNYRNNESGIETISENRQHRYNLGIRIRHFLF